MIYPVGKGLFICLKVNLVKYYLYVCNMRVTMSPYPKNTPINNVRTPD